MAFPEMIKRRLILSSLFCDGYGLILVHPGLRQYRTDAAQQYYDDNA